MSFFWVPSIPFKYFDELFFMFLSFWKVFFDKTFAVIDVVNFIGPRGVLAGCYLKRKYNSKLVCTIEMINEDKGFFNKVCYCLIRWMLLNAPIDGYICWSNYYWEEHLKKWGIPESKVKIIPCGIDTERYSPEISGEEIKKQYAQDMPLIVFAKPLYYENTYAAKLLIEAISILKNEMRVKLLIGDGEGKTVIELLAKKNGIKMLVDFMPPTDFTDIPKYIAASDIIVLPYMYAPTTSRSLLEAMAMGKPIITIPVGEIPNILKDGESVLFTTRNPEQIAHKIKDLLLNKPLSHKLGKQALSIIQTKYDLQCVIQAQKSFMECLIWNGEKYAE
jgi:glycosyltransferase involved in cell wall biosynthesis